jgi:hypothetical protein
MISGGSITFISDVITIERMRMIMLAARTSNFRLELCHGEFIAEIISGKRTAHGSFTV